MKNGIFFATHTYVRKTRASVLKLDERMVLLSEYVVPFCGLKAELRKCQQLKAEFAEEEGVAGVDVVLAKGVNIALVEIVVAVVQVIHVAAPPGAVVHGDV